MTGSAWFWAILVLSVLFYGFAPNEGPNARFWGWGKGIVMAVLFALLGWAVFGGPIK